MKFELLTKEADAIDYVTIVNKSFDKNYDCKNIELDNNQRVLLLKDNDKVIGGALITLKKDPLSLKKSFFIDYICIEEKYRGQRLGLKLFREIESMARKENCDSLELVSSKKRETARKLYISEGMSIKDTNLFIKDLV